MPLVPHWARLALPTTWEIALLMLLLQRKWVERLLHVRTGCCGQAQPPAGEVRCGPVLGRTAKHLRMNELPLHLMMGLVLLLLELLELLLMMHLMRKLVRLYLLELEVGLLMGQLRLRLRRLLLMVLPLLLMLLMLLLLLLLLELHVLELLVSLRWMVHVLLVLERPWMMHRRMKFGRLV